MHPAPSDEQIQALLKKHSLPFTTVEPSPFEGSVNYVRMTGDLCVRVLKVEDYASDIFTEVVSVPAVRACGAVVPELLVFDGDRDIVPGLVTIYRRLHGTPLGECRDEFDLESLYREVGKQIAAWHNGVKSLDDPKGWLDKPELDNAWACYERNAERLSTAERGWTEQTLRRLDQAQPGENSFVHWDLHAHNILVSEGKFVAVLDWGDAGFGETAINYHCLPANQLPLLLDAIDHDHDLVGRCLYASLAYALNDVHRPEYVDQPYRNGGHRRWRNFAALYDRALSESWREWLGDPPPS